MSVPFDIFFYCFCSRALLALQKWVVVRVPPVNSVLNRRLETATAATAHTALTVSITWLLNGFNDPRSRYHSFKHCHFSFLDQSAEPKTARCVFCDKVNWGIDITENIFCSLTRSFPFKEKPADAFSKSQWSKVRERDSCCYIGLLTNECIVELCRSLGTVGEEKTRQNLTFRPTNFHCSSLCTPWLQPKAESHHLQAMYSQTEWHVAMYDLHAQEAEGTVCKGIDRGEAKKKCRQRDLFVLIVWARTEPAPQRWESALPKVYEEARRRGCTWFGARWLFRRWLRQRDVVWLHIVHYTLFSLLVPSFKYIKASVVDYPLFAARSLTMMSISVKQNQHTWILSTIFILFSSVQVCTCDLLVNHAKFIVLF